MSLRIVPVGLDEANAFVELHHRHLKPVPGCKFSVGVAKPLIVGREVLEWRVCGVAIVGRPVARNNDDGWTLEANRCCTDGTRNACSKLYRTSWRVARELGFQRLITYSLPDEGGASLRGAGFTLVGERGGGTWSRATRPRVDTHPLQGKLLWECLA